jgi:hypothetical protein
VKRGEIDMLLHPVQADGNPKLEITKAVYGVPNGTPDQQVDVTNKLAAMIRGGRLSVQATNTLAGRDPLYLTPKTLIVEYTLDGKSITKSVPENGMLQIPENMVFSGHPAVELHDGSIEIAEPGEYTIMSSRGKQQTAHVSDLHKPIELADPWKVQFPPGLGAPASITMEKLIPLNEHTEPGVKFFSGTATYTTTVNVSPDLLAAGQKLYLELGVVKNLAQVSVNGRDLGILWKPPFRIDITSAARAGANDVQVKVTNLWPNRLIGDAALPPQQRVTWTAFDDAYKPDSPLLPSGLLGPVRLLPTVVQSLK